LELAAEGLRSTLELCGAALWVPKAAAHGGYGGALCRARPSLRAAPLQIPREQQNPLRVTGCPALLPRLSIPPCCMRASRSASRPSLCCSRPGPARPARQRHSCTIESGRGHRNPSAGSEVSEEIRPCVEALASLLFDEPFLCQVFLVQTE